MPTFDIVLYVQFSSQEYFYPNNLFLNIKEIYTQVKLYVV